MKLRVGIIGLGQRWERRYCPAVQRLADRFEVRTVYASVRLLAERVARQFDVQAASGFRAVTQRDDIDAVLVLSCDWHGPLPVYAACDAGKAVFCAADLSADLEQARAIRRRVEQAGIAYVGEFPRRYAPATLRLKELLATRLGAPRLLFCHERLRETPPEDAPCPARSLPPTTHIMAEMVDWCRWIVDREPHAVTGVASHAPAEPCGHVYQQATLDFSPPASPAAGPLAQISCGQYIPGSWPEAISFRPPSQLQVCCERGIAFVDLPSTVTWFDQAGRHLESLETERPVGEQLLMHFHRAVTSLVCQSGDLRDAYRNLEIVLACHASSREGRRFVIDA
jgi:predicted dehydrogenase